MEQMIGKAVTDEIIDKYSALIAEHIKDDWTVQQYPMAADEAEALFLAAVRSHEVMPHQINSESSITAAFFDYATVMVNWDRVAEAIQAHLCEAKVSRDTAPNTGQPMPA